MKIALFGGSFDPVHREHINLAVKAKEELGLDKLYFIPSYRAPHKMLGAVAGGEDRLDLLRAACRSLPFAEADDTELKAEGTSYTFVTCRKFRENFPSAEIFFIVGADMLEDFFGWKNPDDILKNVRLAACGRGCIYAENMHERFRARFGTDYLGLGFCGKEISSTDIRVALAFGDFAAAEKALPPDVFGLIRRRDLYRYPCIEGALGLLTEERKAHSERVARMACRRARSLNIPEEKALSAAMLHDCGKNVPLSDPKLKHFTPPEGVPAPVLHQFTGAYLAEHFFGIKDEEILDAIRYHTSGREDMTPLGKLIFLSDMLEEGRNFDGIESLREVFWKDIDLCLYLSFKRQLNYLKARNAPVYPLTQRAFDWLKTYKRFE